MSSPSVTRRNFRQYDRDHGQAGMYCFSPGGVGGLSTFPLVANRAYCMRFSPSRNMAITKLGFEVTTAAGADDAVDVGLYDGTTLARLGSAGAVTGKLNSTGAKTADLTATTNLVAGSVYYAALACGTLGGTAASLKTYTLVTAAATQMFGTTPPTVEQFLADTSHPLPNPIVLTSVNNASIFRFVVRES